MDSDDFMWLFGISIWIIGFITSFPAIMVIGLLIMYFYMGKIL